MALSASSLQLAGVWKQLVRVGDALFGATVPPDSSGRRWLARYLALTGVLALVVFARRPDSILRPQFWAEDGNVFFYQQLTMGFWPAVSTLYGGFPFVGQRLVAAFASGLPLPIVAFPLVHNASAIVITALTMATFSLPVFRHLVRSDGLRTAVCIATVCLPADQELLATPTTLGYFFAIWLVFLSVMAAPGTAAGVAAWCLGGALAVFSTQLAAVVAPFWLLRGMRAVSRRNGAELSFATVQTAALLVVIATAGGMTGVAGIGKNTEPVSSGLVPPWQPVLLWSTLRYLGWEIASCVDAALFPVAVFRQPATLGTLPVVVPALLVALSVVLAFRDLSERGRIVVCLTVYLFVSSLYVVVAGRPIIIAILQGAVPPLSPWAFPALQPRHRVLPNVALLLACAGIIDGAERRRTRVAGTAVALAGLLLAWMPGFRVPPFPDLRWPQWAERLDRKLASGSREPLVIPSWPPGFQISFDADGIDATPASADERTKGPS